MTSVETAGLTKSQAARRHRVLVTALELGAEGGYDAVQMRDVAARADVALGTIYRYFSSKDHLLAAAMVEWVEDLERKVSQHPPRGDTAADRVIDVLGRALRTMEREPKLSAAVMAAQRSNDPAAAQCQVEVTSVMDRIMAAAFPASVDAATVAELSKVLGHVWFSCLVGWTNGIGDMRWVAAELDVAARHLLAGME